jgi:leader peptidase (prepilin peptidase)/N-methyltransferase
VQHFLLLIPLGYLIAISIPLAITDIREHRLPNKLTLSAALLTIASLAAASLMSGDWQALTSALIAAITTFFIGWFLAARAAIGMGDIKLLISLNAFAGYLSPLLPLISMAIAFLAATLISSIFLFGKRLNLQSSIALGPYLLLGFFVAVTPSALEATAEAWS